MRYIAILFAFYGCVVPVDNETTQAEQKHEEPTFPTEETESVNIGGCGSVTQLLPGPSGIALEVPIECDPHIWYDGYPNPEYIEIEEVINNE